MYESTNIKFKELIKNISDNVIQDADISILDTAEIQRFRVLLRLKKRISSVQSSILGDLIYQLQEYQMYKKEYVIEKISTSINNYYNHSLNSNNTGEQPSSFQKYIESLSLLSKDSIANADSFNEFSKYMHIKRDIEDELLLKCKLLNERKSGLILLVGSVGDGKSHLLAYLNNKFPTLFEDIKIYNDATESNNPSSTANQTLESTLEDFYQTEKKMIIAINIGMLHNFYSYLKSENSLTLFQKFIDNSKIFPSNEKSLSEFNSEPIANHSIVSFLDSQNLKIVNGVIQNDFHNKIIKKVFSETEDNPIYSSFLYDNGYDRSEAIYQNYKLLLNNNVQKSILYLLNIIQVNEKRILTTRSILNFLYEIIVPPSPTLDEHSSLLASLLFENKDKSKILESISHHDPSQSVIPNIEDLNITIYNTDNLELVCKDLFEEHYTLVEPTILYLSNLNNKSHYKRYSTILRLYFLFNHHKFISEYYLKYLCILEKNNQNVVKDFIIDVKNAVYKWNGSPLPEYIYKKPWDKKEDIRIGIEFKFKFKNITSVNSSVYLAVYDENDTRTPPKEYVIEIDYSLYILIQRISSGYLIKNNDRNNAINFNEFIEDIVENTVSMKNTLIKSNRTNRLFKISSGIIYPEVQEVK